MNWSESADPTFWTDEPVATDDHVLVDNDGVQVECIVDRIVFQYREGIPIARLLVVRRLDTGLRIKVTPAECQKITREEPK